ncbi:maltooligosyltrehalose trehalohydrolase [Catalinimonas alkaloidigena]|uniref:Malto-oligosyltrehalose trehalohydrolase n=1 Tax=Catalinimonas alkaloidigena TaxID=1075417 RepID=A0A1G9F7D4_9BACT|nr:malto-oligosyltrehalose trehalohydrolase [Catalinimonas alkaloidigena]SDK84270.1 maltooligosyltrehalose trehalohydrolase [Catalinimonas alkaloidigena]
MYRPVGAFLQADACEFTVWAPLAETVSLELSSPRVQSVPMHPDAWGYWSVTLPNIKEGTRYAFLLDSELRRPDPASRHQPEGVHGDSAVVGPGFAWNDQHWQAPPQKDWILYELHVGTFSPEGTFAGVIQKLDHLLELGVNVLEIMPVAQFPGGRNWGYDGVYPFAVQHSYGGARGLKQLVDACHAKGLAVILDVVYNHMGPEGNYLRDFGPYFTDKHHTPWGQGINFDDKHCDPVRSFFLQNARMWLEEFHLDGLRLDAIHAIRDSSAKHLLRELSEMKAELEAQNERQYILIGECDLNDVRYLDPTERNGFGLDAQWIDEFHHALHALTTHERMGYYEDFGDSGQLLAAFQRAFVYNGQYSPHRKRRFGSDASHLPTWRFVNFAQNHDQIGNRMMGDRLATTLSFEALKLTAAVLLLSPYLPMLFMGEEWGEDTPFMYFVSHGDPDLIEAVRTGRKREFAYFQREGHEVPDPQSEKTFQGSKLNWEYANDPQKRLLWQYHRELIRLRREHPALGTGTRDAMQFELDASQHLLEMTRTHGEHRLCAVFNLTQTTRSTLWPHTGHWRLLHNAGDAQWGGSASVPEQLKQTDAFIVPPYGVLVYETTTAATT